MPRLTPRRPSLARLLAAALALAWPAAAIAQDTGAPTLEEIVDAWLGSPHGDVTSEAFRHWDAEGEVPGTCAVCHSSTGLRAYLSGGMSLAGQIDHPVPLGGGVDCTTCHAGAAGELTEMPFPSGETLAVEGASAVCAVCHQGRAAGTTVEAAVAEVEDDTISEEIAFVNPHYGVSAALIRGSEAGSGYEYPGRSYAGPFTHVPGLDTCVGCHQPHSLEVRLASCTTCHEGAGEFTAIRLSPADYDGDGDTSEGIAQPIADLRARLGDALALYASEVAGAPVVYAEGRYPYFFADSDGDGAVSEGEAAYPNRYQAWTPRMLRAAYNYQLATVNPGAYAHNPHYVLQLLHDSLLDLSEAVEVDVSGLVRP